MTTQCDPYKDPIPEIPQELIAGTAAVYAEAFETITGRSFAPDLGGGTVLERIRTNLAPYFGEH